MVRRYGDPVHVRETVHRETVHIGEPVDPEWKPGTLRPHAFVWKGRLYVVRDVLAHWYERRAWWAEGAARAVHGADHEEEPGGQRPDSGDGFCEPAGDREIWRVEASPGQYAGVGVYDLCRSAARSGGESCGGEPGEHDAVPWQLLWVAD